MFNLNGFPPDLIREMLEGIVESEQAFADTACGQQFRLQTALAGNVPVKGSGATLGTTEGYEGLAPGEVAPGEEYDVTYVAYTAKARVGKGILTDEERNDYSAMFSEDAVEGALRTARINANTRLDKYLETIIASTSLNTEAPAGTGFGPTWKSTSSTMASDLRIMREVTAPGADTIIIGRALKNVMLDNDALLGSAISGNNYGGGTAANSILEAWLKEYIGFSNVLFFDKKIDSSGGRGAAPTVSYLFDTYGWVGYANDLVLVHPTGPINDLADIERAAERRAHVVQYTRYDDVIRPTKLKGAVATGFTAAP
jgi:hypothetical protein